MGSRLADLAASSRRRHLCSRAASRPLVSPPPPPPPPLPPVPPPLPPAAASPPTLRGSDPAASAHAVAPRSCPNVDPLPPLKIDRGIGRTAGSLLGAMLMVLFGVISADEAYKAVDLPILGLLFSTMVVSVYLERTDMFKHLGRLLLWQSQGGKDLRRLGARLGALHQRHLLCRAHRVHPQDCAPK